MNGEKTARPFSPSRNKMSGDVKSSSIYWLIIFHTRCYLNMLIWLFMCKWQLHQGSRFCTLLVIIEVKEPHLQSGWKRLWDQALKFSSNLPIPVKSGSSNCLQFYLWHWVHKTSYDEWRFKHWHLVCHSWTSCHESHRLVCAVQTVLCITHRYNISEEEGVSVILPWKEMECFDISAYSWLIRQ